MQTRTLLLRCYGFYRDGQWHGLCLDLDIAAQADTPQALRQKLAAMIESYVETVLDTDDKASIAALLDRRASVQDWLRYLVAVVAAKFQPARRLLFKEALPFHLAAHC
jgi:hypothetical protein